jgi:hypothetical protein
MTGRRGRAALPIVAAAVFACVVLLAAGGVHAQILSPGPLSKAHSMIEGMGNCVRCHGEGSRHDNARCLDCHTEIRSRKDAKAGYHARLGAQTCAECHAEHRGLGAELIEFKPSQRAFDHRLTGWPLEGAHKKNDCKTCHEPRLISADDARRVLGEGRNTFLGLTTVCARCHFDEHRKQVGDRCEKCHTSSDFDKAPLFNHSSMSSFPLTGKHAQVDCKKCHGNLTDETTAADAFPAPRARSYLQFKDIPHANCLDCHDDAHNGAFGRNCTQCHTTSDWHTILKTAEDFGFHDKTGFPLRGMHADVACKQCHGPFPRQKAVFKGLKHGRCADCHVDAHVGQLDKDKAGVVACETCHTVGGFVPVLFDVVAHAKTSFPLEGAHQAVACGACHTADDKLPRRLPTVVRARLESQRRRVLVSDARLEFPQLKHVGEPSTTPVRCEGCHDNPHQDQFDQQIAKQGCNACHQQSSFRDETFRHDDSRFPLTGRHKVVACGSCHVDEDVAGKKRKKGRPVAFVRYRPLAVECASCHVDEHVGQLAVGGATDCARCHQTTGFVPSTFDHLDPERTRFVLEGRHKDVPCARCHAAVTVAGVDAAGKTTSRYRPVPTDCRACHEDEHQGRFDGFAP